MEMDSLLLIKKITSYMPLTKTETKNKSVIILVNLGSSSTANESPVAFCTNDIKIIAMRVSGTD